MLERLTLGARRALVLAQRSARTSGADRIEAIHLLLGLVRHSEPDLLPPEAIEIQLDGSEPPPPMDADEERRLRRQLRDRGLTPGRAERFLQRLQAQRAYGPVEVSPAVERVIGEAVRAHGEPGPRDLLRHLMASPPPDVDAAVRAAGTSVEAIRRRLAR